MRLSCAQWFVLLKFCPLIVSRLGLLLTVMLAGDEDVLSVSVCPAEFSTAVNVFVAVLLGMHVVTPGLHVHSDAVVQFPLVPDGDGGAHVATTGTVTSDTASRTTSPVGAL